MPRTFKHQGYDYFPSAEGGMLLMPLSIVDAEMKRLRNQKLATEGPAENETALAESAEHRVADGHADVPWPEVPIHVRHGVRRHRALPSERYCVIPRWDQFGSDQDELTRTADTDRRTQRNALRARLRTLGPDRKLARPRNWRRAIAELKTEMPNFTGPIALVERCLALGEVSATPVRIPPMLLLGPPGIGKTLFSQRIASVLETSSGTLAFDAPSYGSTLRGLDKSWGNSESGLLFNMLCLGKHANPVVLLDEIDKAVSSDHRNGSPLNQLHGVLEPQTSSCIQDLSTEIEFDASLVTYVATANSLSGIGMPILSRFEIFDIPAPTSDEAVHIAENIGTSVLERLGLAERLAIERRAYYVLARVSPRLIVRTLEKLLGDAVLRKIEAVSAESVWKALGFNDELPSQLH